MNRRSVVVSMIMAGTVCAGLVWASQRFPDLVRGPHLAQAGESAGASFDTHREQVAVFNPYSRYSADAPPASVQMPSLEQQSYSLAAPVFLQDPAAFKAHSIAVGDVSGDGRDDLVFLSLREEVIPSESRMEVYVAYQRDDGRLDAAVRIGDSGNNLAYQLVVADMDRDGRSDIITAVFDGVLVLRSNADGTFTRSTALAGDPNEMIVTDVDRDGHLDVLVDSSNTAATVVHGDGRGGIARTSTLPLPASAVRTTGDVTGDGLDDLILATIFNSPFNEFRIYRALASGGYAAPVVLYRPGDGHPTDSLAVGDFNGDGRGDLMVAEAKNFANLQMYLQDAQGNLLPSIEIARHQSSSGPMIATDLDRDGRTDLAIAHTGWGYVGYYLQTATGLTPETVIDAYQHHGRLNYFAVGDLNNDGCRDLVAARVSQTPVMLYGQGCIRRRIVSRPLPALHEARPTGGATGMSSPLMSSQGADKRINLR
jgi:hypothetical protein